jgi:hypothetical protein
MVAVVIRGIDRTTPNDVAYDQGDKTSSDRVIYALQNAKTLVTDGAAILYAVTPNSSTIACTPPTGYTELADRNTALTGNRAFQVGYKLDLDAGAIGPVSNSTGFSTSAKSIGVTLLLRPATPRTGTTTNTKRWDRNASAWIATQRRRGVPGGGWVPRIAQIFTRKSRVLDYAA